jgi:phenylpropionate dioxygenase-like ring-hydroxylating dioxygenase large terminal subunit
MVASKKYKVIDPETGALDRRIFVDEDVYQEELEKIFGRAWLMIGHTSLVPNVNDFFHTYMGEDPVILTRDGNGTLHAFLNMCRHRGNRIIRADDGNAKSFMCTYHGWTYTNDGSLEHVPGEEQVYYNNLDKESLRLVEAKVDTYAGIVFATWDQDAPTLEAYLGDARWYLDTVFNRRSCGMVALGPQKWMEPVNWKTPVDNCSDNYHVPVTHLSSMIAQERHQGRPRLTQEGQLGATAFSHMTTNGHALTVQVLDDENEDSPRYFHGVTQDNIEAFKDWQRDGLPEVEERLGIYRARKLNLTNHSLFPNGVLGFRLALPRGPLMTEFWHFVLYEADAPEVVARALRTGYGNANGAAGLFEQDDIDNWRSVTEASRSPVARKVAQDLSMGHGRAGAHDDYAGIVSEEYISENNQRHFYLRWQEFMNAERWADIPIEPISADFEGTASMDG